MGPWLVWPWARSINHASDEACKVCGDHLKQHLEEDPVDDHLTTRGDVEEWLINLHNKVNETIGKPEVTAEEAYQSIDGQCGEAPSALDIAKETLAANQCKLP